MKKGKGKERGEKGPERRGKEKRMGREEKEEEEEEKL